MTLYSPQEFATQTNALISLPTVYEHIRHALEHPHTPLAEASRALATDPSLAAQVLRAVNSPLYGYGGRVDCLDQAVHLLGLQRVHDLVLAMSLATVFDGIRPAQLDVTRFWRDSVLRGIAARDIARRNDSRQLCERMLLIGMLADIGHLALYQTVPELIQEAWQCAQATGEAPHTAQRRVIGCDHAEIAASLLTQWNLPPLFAAIIGAQTDPRQGGEFAYEAAIINVANHIVAFGQDGHGHAHTPIAATVLAQLELPWIEIEPLRRDAYAHVDDYLRHFFPTLAQAGKRSPN